MAEEFRRSSHTRLVAEEFRGTSHTRLVAESQFNH